jgi:hypothetical protein
MTAEIAVMNKNAVALAADSAVTIGRGEKVKIYNTNKLFMLSKYHPVGVMIYGNAEFLGVSWDTTIKSFRKILGSDSYPSLEDYGAKFITFLESNRALFPESEQDEWVHSKIYQSLSYVRSQIDEKVEKVSHEKGLVTDDELKAIIKETVLDFYGRVDRQLELSLASDNLNRCINKKYGDFVRKIIGQVFQKLPISTVLRKKLREFCRYLLFKDLDIGNQSGLVIAGFGEDEYFPTIVQYEIDGIVCNKLKYKVAAIDRVNTKERATVFPFAQTEMVHTFMQGIDPKLQFTLQSYLEKLFTNIYPEQIVKVLPGMTAKNETILKGKLENVGGELVKEFFAALEKQKREQNIDPVVEAVAFLPKEELASMAESLVNLTSFKRRVTLDAETVGGPIDVAVISKGDGFIWVKRKHYFDIANNPQFGANYFR